MTTPSDQAARQAIDRTNRAFEAAFNAGDPERAAREVYTRDARVLPPGAPLQQGRDTIAKFWVGAAQQLGVTRVALKTVELEVFGDHAAEIGQATLTLGGGGEAVAKYVVVWKQEDGHWRWHYDIWNTDA